MNLSITPVKFNNYSPAQNGIRNNNQSQNFGMMKATVFRHPEAGNDVLNAIRKRDMVVDKFVARFEELAETHGVNTEIMDKEGYSLAFIPKFAFSTKMSAILKNKSQEIVRGQDRLPIMVDLRRGNEFNQAEELVHLIQDANLIRSSN